MMSRIHWILGGCTGVLALLSVNRLLPWTLGFVDKSQFLRWVDLNALLGIPLLAVLFFYALRRELLSGVVHIGTTLHMYDFILMIGVYIFGAAGGVHEVTNYLNQRFCESGIVVGDICRIIEVNDNTFGHILFYIGFLFMNVGIVGIEYEVGGNRKLVVKDWFFLSLNSVLVGAGIFMNLAFEDTGLDRIFFLVALGITGCMLYCGRRVQKFLPVTYSFFLSYVIGLGGTVVYILVLR